MDTGMSDLGGDARNEFPHVDLGLRNPYLNVVPHGSRLPGRNRYLCIFLHRYLSFRLAEVEGLAAAACGKIMEVECPNFCVIENATLSLAPRAICKLG
jgi:hypothetical protein